VYPLGGPIHFSVSLYRIALGEKLHLTGLLVASTRQCRPARRTAHPNGSRGGRGWCHGCAHHAGGRRGRRGSFFRCSQLSSTPMSRYGPNRMRERESAPPRQKGRHGVAVVVSRKQGDHVRSREEGGVHGSGSSGELWGGQPCQIRE
jgi:hypothetical protein